MKAASTSGVVALAVLFVAAIWLGARGTNALARHQSGVDAIPDGKALVAAIQARTRQRIGLRDGRYLQLMYFATSDCGFCRIDSMKQQVRTIDSTLFERAGRDSMRYSSHGVAVEWPTADGLAYLQSLAPFDEVSSGMSWLNNDAVTYLFRDHAGRPSVPSLVLVARNLAVVNGRQLVFSPDTVIWRVSGIDGISRLARAIASIPLVLEDSS